MKHIEIGLASPVTAMEAFLDPHRPWIESVVGCSRPEALTAAAFLNLLRRVEPPKRVNVMGGRAVPFPENGYDWTSVVLDPSLNRLVRDDYEAFFEREAWFARHRIPYRRGYLLYGPPGNDKTSVARIMACRPQVSAFSIDFSSEGLPNEALSHLFETAGDNAPALVILEDLDRVFGANSEGMNRTQITLQQLLNSLDGLGTQDGVVVVATANNPNSLDPALLRRPGRFDRLALFPVPSFAIRKEYLARLTDGTLDEQAIAAAASESNRLSFAQIREAYILAGQFALQGDGEIRLEELLAGLRRLRGETNGLSVRADGRAVGFEAGIPGESPAEAAAICKKH